MTGHIKALPGLASPAGHAHEMLFGFALAVVAGNQLGPSGIARLAGLLGFWALARATFVLAPQSIAAAAANATFAVLLAAQIAPRLLGAAKKWRNQALPLVLIGICAAAAAFHVAPEASLELAVLLFALLMLFMGGRIIAPAVAGQFYRQGAKLDARVQPRVEAGLIVAMAIAVASALAGDTRFIWLTGAPTSAAGLLAAGVPAALGALVTALGEFGTMSLAQVVEPALAPGDATFVVSALGSRAATGTTVQ